jgi:hypothetical protein
MEVAAHLQRRWLVVACGILRSEGISGYLVEEASGWKDAQSGEWLVGKGDTLSLQPNTPHTSNGFQLLANAKHSRRQDHQPRVRQPCVTGWYHANIFCGAGHHIRPIG